MRGGEVIVHLFEGSEEDLPQLAGLGVKEIAVRSVTIDTINLRISSILSDETVLDQTLELELVALDGFTRSRHPFSSVFIHFRMYDHVANALQRQLKNGSSRCMNDVLSAGDTLLWSVFSYNINNSSFSFFFYIV